MKILLGNNTLSWLGGTELWILTLAIELKKLGHDLTAYSPELGLIATKLEAIGVKCVKEIAGQGGGAKPFDYVLDEEDTGEYDVVICAHYEITKHIKSRLPNVPIIAVVHGIIHNDPKTGNIWPEHPVTDFKVDQYLAVSEEVQDLMLEKYGIQAKLLRNFFDLDRFNFIKQTKLTEKIKTIMVNSNWWGVEDPINQIIKEVADHYDARFIGIGINFQPTFEVEDIVKQADIVFGMGRSVLEGVCMGKIGVVHGRWGTGGVISPENYKELRMTNFSGRKWKENNALWPSKEIVSTIDNGRNLKTISAMRKIMEENHNVKVAAKEIIKIAEGLIKK